MLIDWFTVGAQVLNFLTLVWLMKRFLYKPILDAIDAREKRIAAAVSDTEAKDGEARKERDTFHEKNEVFDQERAALLAKATDEAGTERQRLLDEARDAATALGTKRMETLRNEEQDLRQSIGRRTQQEVFAVARKALADLATVSLEERLGEVFIRQLRVLDGDSKERLSAALKTGSEPAVVRSAFDLPEEQHEAVQNAINETFSEDIPLRFETAPDLIGGIELAANGQKIIWSIAGYLDALEKDARARMDDKEKSEAEAVPAQDESKTEAATP